MHQDWNNKGRYNSFKKWYSCQYWNSRNELYLSIHEDICEILEKMRQFVNIAANSGCNGCKGKLLK